MNKAIMTGLIAVMFLGLNTAAQDWYHDRDTRYNEDHWRSHVFSEVRTDLDHVWSEKHASDKERERLERTKQELTDLQEKLDHGEWDNGHVNDVIDSLRKSANDNRLSDRDRALLNDDVTRIKDHIEHDALPVAVVRPAEVFRSRLLLESIALAEAHAKELGYEPTMDPDFVADLTEIINSRKQRDLSAWE